jgi:hypothetical protein
MRHMDAAEQLESDGELRRLVVGNDVQALHAPDQRHDVVMIGDLEGAADRVAALGQVQLFDGDAVGMGHWIWSPVSIDEII